MSSFIAGAVQWAPEFLDPARGAEKAVAAIEQAAGDHVRLLVFPESWLLGYPYWSGITPSDPEYQAFRQVLFERAIDIHGPEMQRVWEWLGPARCRRRLQDALNRSTSGANPDAESL